MRTCERCGAELTPEDGPGPGCAKCAAQPTDQQTGVEPAGSEPPKNDRDNIPTLMEEPTDTHEAATVMFDESSSPQSQQGDPGEIPLSLHGDEEAKPPTHAGRDSLTRFEEHTPASPADSKAAATIELDQKIRKLWRGADDGVPPSATLRVEAPHLERDTHLSVSERPIAYPETESDDKADYRVMKFVAEGGMGRVYLAQQTSLGRNVALKTLRDDLSLKDRHRRKFFAEASITGRLDHPNIVPIHDLGVRGDGVPFYSMKFVTGEPWSDTIYQLSKPENLRILMSVADAMAFAHSRKILHRDLKPENVMLGEYGEVLVADWGLAIHLERDRDFALGGTPLYMSPEMANHDVPLIGVRSDIYLLGAILFEILEKKTPHAATGKTATERLLVAAMNQIQPHQSNDELIEVALRALSTNPSDRYASVEEFQEAIRECQRHADSRDRAERATTELQEASETGENERFARAVFAFQDAIELWPENRAAREGLSAARLAYAENALEQEDYALGLSLVDPAVPEHQAVHKKLLAAQQSAQSRSRRLRIARGVAIGAMVAVIGVLAVFGFYADNAARTQARLTEKAETNAAEAIRQKGLADENAAKAEKNAEEAEQNAIRANDNADKFERAAQKARDNEERARQNERAAIAARNEATKSESRAKHRAFIAEMALTAADLAVSDTDSASERLASIESDFAPLLDWEADRLRYLCHQDFAREQLSGSVASMAASPGGDAFAFLVGQGAENRLFVGRYDPIAQGLQLQEPRELSIAAPRRAALSSSGAVAVGGTASQEGQPLVQVIHPTQPQQEVLLVSPRGGWEVTALAFAPDGRELAIAHHAPLSVRVQIVEFPAAKKALDATINGPAEYAMAGSGAFTALTYSADGQRLAAVESSREAAQANVTVWSRVGRSGPFTGKIKLPTQARSVAFHPQNNRVIACGGLGGELVIFELPAQDGGQPAVRRYQRHADDITQVSFAPDGRSLVTTSQSGVALVWTRGGDDLNWSIDARPPVRHLSPLRGGAWAGDGNTLVTSSADGGLRSWPLERYYNVHRQSTVAASRATSIAADEEESRLVIGDSQGHTRVFDTASSGGPLADFFVGHPGDAIDRVWQVEQGGEVDWVSLAFYQGEATLCRWANPTRTFLAGVDAKDFYDLSPDGQTMVVAGLQEIRVLRTSDSQVLAQSTFSASSIAYLPGGALVVGDARGRVSLMEINGDRLELVAPTSIATGKDLKWIAAPRRAGAGALPGDVCYAGTDGAAPTVYRLSVSRNGAEVLEQSPQLPAPLSRLTTSARGVYAVCGDRGEAFSWSPGETEWSRLAPSELAVQEQLPPSFESRSPVMFATPRGEDRVATLTREGFLRLWRIASPGAPIEGSRVAPRGARITAAQGTTGDSLAMIAVDGDRAASPYRVNLATGEATRLNLPGGTRLTASASCACDATGRVVAWEPSLGQWFNWEADRVEATAVQAGAGGALMTPAAVALEPQGRQVAVAARDADGRQELLLWTDPNSPPRRRKLDQSEVTALAFTDSGARLLAGTTSGRIVVYDISVTSVEDAEGELEQIARFDELTSFAEHRRPITTIGFSPSGRTLLSGDSRGEVIRWPSVTRDAGLGLRKGRAATVAQD